MKCLVLYAYPAEPDGTSLQGDLLYKGLLHNNYHAIPCPHHSLLQKSFHFLNSSPTVCYGIGFWGNVPDVVSAPLKHGLKPVPWFNSDGWIGNYQKEFDQLELMFTTSEWVKSIYKRDGVDTSKIVPMHIGIDTDTFKPHDNNQLKESIRNMLKIKKNEKIIMTIGGDVTSKGAQEVMRALALVNEEFKDWKYVCKVWPSTCAAQWKKEEMALAKELGIKDKIVYIKDRFSPEFMAEMLNACDIYAAPSRLEGYGMIQVEAMGCGKPVVSINKMGPGETIIHNKTGLLADIDPKATVIREQEVVHLHHGFKKKVLLKFDSPKEFAYQAKISDLKKHLLKLLTDEELCKKMGEAGAKHVKENLDYRHIAKKMADITKDRLRL